MKNNLIGLSHDTQEKVMKQIERKSIKHLKLWHLSDWSSKLWTVLKIYSKNYFDYFCADIVTISDIVLVSEIEFKELYIS